MKYFKNKYDRKNVYREAVRLLGFKRVFAFEVASCLRSQGYDVSASEAGYRLPDLMLPRERIGGRWAYSIPAELREKK